MTRTPAPGAAKEIEMTTHFRSLMFVAAVAILPVACGTSSPMGADLAALEADAQVTSLRIDPTVPVPPQAPEPQSPESDTAPAPAPSEPENNPEPDPKDPQAPENDPAEDPTSRPAPPSVDTSFPVPTPSTVPTNIPSPSPNVPSPSPNDETAPVPPPEPSKCLAASIEIRAMREAIVEPAGEGFMAILSDRNGLLIEDGSCEKLVWAVDGGARDQSRIVIHYESDSRFVYMQGMRGTYQISVTAPNGVTGWIAVEVL